MARTFAVTGTATDLSSSLIQSIEDSSDAEIAQARNASGAISDEKAYSATQKVTVEFITDSGDTLPSVGTSAVTSAMTGLVENVTETERNTEFQSGRFTVTKGDSATQVAIS